MAVRFLSVVAASCCIGVLGAEEAAPVVEEVAVVTESQEPVAVDEKPEEPAEPEDPDDNDPVFDDPPVTAADLEDKMGELMNVLNTTGNVDPETKQQLEGLLDQLKQLGLNTEKLNEAMGDSGEGGTITDTETAKKLMTACAVMSARHAGTARASTRDSLKKIGKADTVTASGLTEDKLLILINTCAEELTHEELQRFDSRSATGGAKKLPQRVLEMAESEEWIKKAAEMDVILLGALRPVASELVASLEEIPKTGRVGAAVPIWMSLPLVAGFLGAMGFLGWKFIEMQSELGSSGKGKKVKSK